ncbi:hypothetical protein [[Phormidium] sp. ETS-05]|uniref:hypothetical protein n=1 Tax=[Phormidium] sp. ETS-05 TaxID=222819 RepID=UPI0018EF272D|nr:hypothetical protein [[Phormidium] sp. ETS-05]
MEKLLLAAGFTISLHFLVSTSTPSTSQPNWYFHPQETAHRVQDGLPFVPGH